MHSQFYRLAELKRDLQYRMYCRYDHWMLDEFQDTSQPQWRVIKPFLDDLAESKTGNESSIFVVGDIKQSVYQWRGGDPELFRSVSSQLQLEQRGMSTSYRSVQPVLDLVNDICDYARTAPGCILRIMRRRIRRDPLCLPCCCVSCCKGRGWTM
mgnify:CR=1 FL=1